MKKILIYIAFLCLSNVYSQCFTTIGAGYSHSLGLKPDGTIWGWGFGQNGGLGDGTDMDSSLPIQMGNDSNWTKLFAGYSNTFAIKNDGSLWGTGYNLYGALGINSTVDHTSVFTQIGTANNWSELAAGETYEIGLKTDHTMWGWGFNLYFNLGDGTTIQRNSPVQIGTTADWKTICSTRLDCSFAIKNDGTLWGWGINTGNILGIGAFTWSQPTLRDTATNWDKLALGQGYHVMALKTDHTLWAWGLGDFGQTGHDPNSTYGNSQINQIPGLWSAMAVGGDKFSMGIKTDGTLWAWGNNNIGQLGNGTTNNTYIPVQVGTDNNWVSVSCGHVHTIALKSDGSLWAWGDNMYGELGDGTMNSTTTPHVVPIAGCTLSTDEYATTKPLLKVYPNPVKEDLDFSYTGNEMITTVVVYDLSGREVYISHPVVSTNLKGSIKLGSLSSGSYILCLKNKEHTVVSQKIIKE